MSEDHYISPREPRNLFSMAAPTDFDSIHKFLSADLAEGVSTVMEPIKKYMIMMHIEEMEK